MAEFLIISRLSEDIPVLVVTSKKIMGRVRRVYDPKTEAEALGVSIEAYMKVFILGKIQDNHLIHLTAVYFILKIWKYKFRGIIFIFLH